MSYIIHKFKLLTKIAVIVKVEFVIVYIVINVQMLDKAPAILIAKCFGNGLIFELFWFESWSDFAMLLYSNHVLLVIDLKLELGT